MIVISVIEIIVYVLLLINVVYIFIFSVASLCKPKQRNNNITTPRNIAVLIPAYKEDGVIMECVNSCMAQNYPKDNFTTIVISDNMSDSTNTAIRNSGAVALEVTFENSTKAKALNYAMSMIPDSYDIAVVLDADNTIYPDFLTNISNAFNNSKCRIFQAHRKAKNLNTDIAYLDAVSEEINNSIFRLGHSNLGMATALIGSGMAFDYAMFKSTMLNVDAVGGFDRALELALLYDGESIEYLHDVPVLDEKVQQSDVFSNQRRRWMSAQIHYLKRYTKNVFPAIKSCNIDFLDKMFQQTVVPRIMLVGLTFIISIAISIFSLSVASKWWVLFMATCISLLLAIPTELYTTRLLKAVLHLPKSFVLMFLNFFKLKGANKKFIHTSHGVK